MILVGFAAKRGHAWHFDPTQFEAGQSNHYEGAIPIEDAVSRIFPYPYHYAQNFGQIMSPERDANGDLVPYEVDGAPLILPDANSIKIAHTMNGQTFNWVDNGGHSDSFQIHQPVEWLIDTCKLIVDDDGLQLATVGKLRGGAVCWAQFELPETLIIDGVQIRPFLLATTSVDGSIATTFGCKGTNVTCDNTHAAAMSEKGQSYSVKHTAHSSAKLSDARQALNLVIQNQGAFKREIEILLDVKVSEGDWEKLLFDIAPQKDEESNPRGATVAQNKRDAINGLWMHDARVAPWRNSGWGAIQAVNTHAHWMTQVRGDASRAERSYERMVSGAHDSLDADSIKRLARVLVPKEAKKLAPLLAIA
jgi:phage/plasmid-like protein (TIGR03299 family)